jgi:predicted nucleic acid-binding protein
MIVRAFADTNIIVYAQSDDGAKTANAIAVLESAPVVSTQVVNETVAVLTRKHGFSLTDAHQVATSLLAACEVVPLTADTIREAIRLTARYQLSHWDSLIVSAALLAGCGVLYSEDLQNGQVFEKRLTVVNPFIDAPGTVDASHASPPTP